MRDYPNVLAQSLKKDEKFNAEVQSAIKKFFKEEKESILKDKKFNAKVIKGNENFRYLLVDDLEYKVFSVYQEEISSWNKKDPFQYAIKSLKESGDVYSSTRIFAFPTKKEKESEDKGGINGLIAKLKNLGESASNSEIIAMLRESQTMRCYRDGAYTTTSCAYQLRNFCQFLGVERNEQFFVKHSEGMNPIIQDKLSDLLVSLNYMFDVTEKEKFNSKNKFTYNDADNHLWKHEKGIAFDSQNFGFYCVMKDNDVIIYSWDQGGNNCKPCTSISKLTKDIKAGNTNLIDHVALQVENGKVTFVDNTLIYCLDLDIMFTKNALVEEGYGEPIYPVDIKSFDYQLAYYQKRYNYSEFEFMNQAMLTLGGGFGYDAESGRFYDDSVRYDTSVGTYQHEEEGKAIGIYGAPKGFTNLDKDWTAAVGRFIEKLKKDRPEPIMGDTKKEKAKILDDIIKKYEKDLAKLTNAPKAKV